MTASTLDLDSASVVSIVELAGYLSAGWGREGGEPPRKELRLSAYSTVAFR